MSGPSAGLDLAEYEALLRADFSGFAERAFVELNPQTDFAANWHFRVIAAKLAAVREGRIRRLAVNVPPRHLKSHLASVSFPAWCLGHSPSAQILCVSYAQDLGDKLSRLPPHRHERLVPKAIPGPSRTAASGGTRVRDHPTGQPAGHLGRRCADRTRTRKLTPAFLRLSRPQGESKWTR